MQLFSMLIANTAVGTIPSVCDAVQLTTLPMLRHRRSRVLIVLGADDGLLPAFSDPGGLLADPERQQLRSLGVGLGPGRAAAGAGPGRRARRRMRPARQAPRRRRYWRP